MTFVRALQVEYSIVDELIEAHMIVPPKDHDNPALKHLISEDCQEECLEKAVSTIRAQAYLPIGLPLLAFAPAFPAHMVNRDLPSLSTDWSAAQKARAVAALRDLPDKFMQNQFSGNPLLDLQRVFGGVGDAAGDFPR